MRRRELAAAVAERKAAAPAAVRTVLDGGLGASNDERKRVARHVAEWLVGAHARAHVCVGASTAPRETTTTGTRGW